MAYSGRIFRQQASLFECYVVLILLSCLLPSHEVFLGVMLGTALHNAALSWRSHLSAPPSERCRRRHWLLSDGPARR